MNEADKISEDSRHVTYNKKYKNYEYSISFDKELKRVEVSASSFQLNEQGMMIPQEKREKESEWIQYSCKYGHWQAETIIILSNEDLVFIDKKRKELFINEM